MAESTSHKSERLINLTMALLAAKRFMSKNEIFEAVEGYEGSPESKERMFERDKTELRALGLDIEVGNDDPLFNDESGYRINPRNYSLDIGEMAQEDLSLLSLAAAQWQDSLLSNNAQSALRKVEALHGAIDTANINLSFIQRETAEAIFSDLWGAINNHQEISFDYRSRSLSHRKVQPLALYLSKSRWYFVGHDIAKDELRKFKVARVVSESLSIGKSFPPRLNFNLEEYLRTQKEDHEAVAIELQLRKGRAQEIRALVEVTDYDGDWDLVWLTDYSVTEAFELIARAGDSAKIRGPIDLQVEFLSWISEKRHV